MSDPTPFLRSPAVRGGTRRSSGASKRLRMLSAAAFALALSAPAAAQQDMRPGLWEVQLRNAELDAARKQMQQQLAQMPPAQRAQMEKMMGSATAGMLGGGPMKVCHTAASLKQRGPVEQEPGCTVKTSMRGDTHLIDFQCQDGRRGKGEFVHKGDSYRGFIEATDPRRPGTMRMEHEGRWIGADCGTVKPVQ